MPASTFSTSISNYLWVDGVIRCRLTRSRIRLHFLIMRALFILLLAFGMGSNLHAKKIHVDFTVTSTTGCTFHIVGELDVDIKIPLSSSTISGFNGSIPIGGASGCPGGTFEVNFGYVVSTGGSALDPEE